MDIETAKRRFSQRLDTIFQALPPLDSPEYLRHLDEASKEELPAAVLVRAYRQLCGAGRRAAAEHTLRRLLGKKSGRHEYLGSLLYLASMQVPPNQGWQDTMDLFQDAIVEMIEVLPTKRGAYGETAWRAFCKQCLDDAWRRRQGRRGERIEPERAEPRISDRTGKEEDPRDDIFLPGPLHGWAHSEPLERVTEIVLHTVEQITDPLIRAVVEDQWLSGDPSPISGERTSDTGKPALTIQMSTDRDRINRAMVLGWARLLAALERELGLNVDLERFQGKIRSLSRNR